MKKKAQSSFEGLSLPEMITDTLVDLRLNISELFEYSPREDWLNEYICKYM